MAVEPFFCRTERVVTSISEIFPLNEIQCLIEGVNMSQQIHNHYHNSSLLFGTERERKSNINNNNNKPSKGTFNLMEKFQLAFCLMNGDVFIVIVINAHPSSIAQEAHLYSNLLCVSLSLEPATVQFGVFLFPTAP